MTTSFYVLKNVPEFFERRMRIYSSASLGIAPGEADESAPGGVKQKCASENRRLMFVAYNWLGGSDKGCGSTLKKLTVEQ